MWLRNCRQSRWLKILIAAKTMRTDDDNTSTNVGSTHKYPHYLHFCACIWKTHRNHAIFYRHQKCPRLSALRISLQISNKDKYLLSSYSVWCCSCSQFEFCSEIKSAIVINRQCIFNQLGEVVTHQSLPTWFWNARKWKVFANGFESVENNWPSE